MGLIVGKIVIKVFRHGDREVIIAFSDHTRLSETTRVGPIAFSVTLPGKGKPP